MSPLDKPSLGAETDLRRESCHSELPRPVVEAVLLRWLELRGAQGREHAEGSAGVQRDARAEAIWAATVASAVAACPHNPPRQRWEPVIGRCIGSFYRRFGADAAGAAADLLLPHLQLLVQVGEVFARVRLEADSSSLAAQMLYGAWRRGLCPRAALEDAEARAEAWLDAFSVVRRATITERVMGWLANRFAMAAAADSSFLRER